MLSYPINGRFSYVHALATKTGAEVFVQAEA